MPNQVIFRDKVPHRRLSGRVVTLCYDTIFLDVSGNFDFFGATAVAGDDTTPLAQQATEFLLLDGIIHISSKALTYHFRNSSGKVSAVLEFPASVGQSGLTLPLPFGKGKGGIISSNASAGSPSELTIAYYVSHEIVE